MNKINPVILAAERGGVGFANTRPMIGGEEDGPSTEGVAMTRQGRGCVRPTLRSQDHQNPAGLTPSIPTGGRPGRFAPRGVPAPSIQFPRRGDVERCGGVDSQRHAHESRNRPVSQRGQRLRGRRLLGSCLRTGVNEVASRGNLRRGSVRPATLRTSFLPTGSPVNSGGLSRSDPSRRLAGFVRIQSFATTVAEGERGAAKRAVRHSGAARLTSLRSAA